jgi:hypothetical protein
LEIRNGDFHHHFSEEETTCDDIACNKKGPKERIELECLGCVCEANGMQTEQSAQVQEPFHLQTHPRHFYRPTWKCSPFLYPTSTSAYRLPSLFLNTKSKVDLNGLNLSVDDDPLFTNSTLKGQKM